MLFFIEGMMHETTDERSAFLESRWVAAVRTSAVPRQIPVLPIESSQGGSSCLWNCEDLKAHDAACCDGRSFPRFPEGF